MVRFENKRVNEALELLNTAARDNKTKLQTAMKSKYADLTSLVSEFGAPVKHSGTESPGANKKKLAVIPTNGHSSAGRRRWVYLGGASAIALVSGFLLGRWRNH